MDEDRIDVSAGLDFSLELFALHRLSGTLQAQLSRVPGLPKNCIARLELINGAVFSCSVTDKQGQPTPIARDVLIRLNKERGPFEWSFHPAKVIPPNHTMNQMRSTQPPEPSAFPLNSGPFPGAADTNALIPKAIASLDWHWFHNWTPQQRQVLVMLWQLIDGRHTVGEMKEALAGLHPPVLVDETLQALLRLKVIVLVR